jgi:UDP-2-acetamido-3-amino-2,3-dideoxy-glucuronate N-acetyltransferase
MVGHILLYHPAVIKMKEIITNGEIGKLEYIYSNRLNLGRVRKEENILWSFAPHDISVIQYFAQEEPAEVFSHGAMYLQKDIEDTTITYLKYANGINAHIFVNWLHPFKEQRMVVIGSNGMLVFEDSLPDEKLKLYHKDYKFENGNIKGSKDYDVIEFDGKPPLQAEQEHFFDCVINNKEPLTNGKHALEVMKILVAGTKELKA